MTNKENTYGESVFYKDKSGAQYFSIQNRHAKLGALLTARTFKGLVGPKDTVLDFGCAGGWLLKQLSPKRKVGVEINELAHPVCQQNGVEVYTRLDQVPSEKFTRIISSHVLEHVPYPIAALKSLRDFLEDDGLLILVLPIDDWRNERVFNETTFGSMQHHHLHTWTPMLLANTLAEAGFHAKSVRVSTHAWPPKFYLLGRILPRPLFDRICWIWAILKNSREIVCVAKKAT